MDNPRYRLNWAFVAVLLVVVISGAGSALGAPDIWDADFATLGIVYQEANVAPGTRYWRLVEAWADDPDEGGGRINIFFRARDLNGIQQGGLWVRTQFGAQHVDTQTKTPPDYGDFPMSGGNWCPATPPGPYTTYMIGRNQGSPDPSDRVVGMGLPCNYHWSFRLTFVETIAQGAADTPTPVASPTPTLTGTPGPSATPTTAPTLPPGEAAWKLSYARQYGQYITGGVAGQVELFATSEDGVFQRAGMTNASNAGTAIFGYTQPASDPFTPGNLRVAFDINNRVYDFRVYDPPVKSDRTPDCYWLDGLPFHGHYKWEFWFRKVANESAYEFFPTEPVYHYDRVNGFNTATQQAPNFSSDAFSLSDWTTDHWQTFVVPAGVNRIIAAKAFAVRQEGAKFRMVFSIHAGGRGGAQVGPSVTSREKSSNEFANVKVDWGLEAVPVVPGETYALRVAALDGQGFNMYATNNDNYAQGLLYNGGTALPGRDMVAVITGARAVTVTPPPTETPTPSPSVSPTASPSASPTQTPRAQAGPVYDYRGLFEFAQHWMNAEGETDYFETGYDFVADGLIDVRDLLTIFDTWGQAPPTPTPSPSPTVTPTPTVTPIVDVQLLTNPSFELPAGSVGANPTGWTSTTGGGMDQANQGVLNASQFGGVDPLPATYPDGVQVARAFVTSWGQIPSPHGWYQQVSVVPGAEYTLSGYLWTGSQGGSPANQQGRIGVDLNGASSNVAAADVWAVPSGQGPSVDGWFASEMAWTLLTTRFTAAAGTVTVYVDARNLQGVEWSGAHFDWVRLMGPAPGQGGTPTPTPQATMTVVPATPTPTMPAGNVVYQVNFETFAQVNWGAGLDFDLPIFTQNYWMWPLHDGGEWNNLDFAISTDSRSGNSVQIQLKNVNTIRGAGLEMLFAGDRPLAPDKMHTVTVWAKSDFAGGNEYSDLVLAREPGSCSCSNIQGYGGTWRTRATNVGGWQQMSISFRSNANTAVGDKILIAFAGNANRALYSAVFDDLVITQTEP